ncbi:Pdp3-interacting factor 1 [Leucoagaricus sp. SymC.cos]|nr:Pdp3-interacting factor 1 [Leucoagaricus sp. SymC.cos]
MHAFPRSSVLVLEDARSISSLIPSTLVDQVDALLDSHRIDDAAVLVDQRRKKLEGNLIVDPDEAEELQYAYQVIGFKCFSETLFEDAGRNLFNGSLDPRVLVSYYPDLRGGLFGDESEVDVFAGVAERMPSARNAEELILNYSPHLSPDSPPSLELTRVLNDAAREMLLVFLEKSRKRARVEGGMQDLSVGITRVVDTVLAKLYAQSQNLTALNHLLTSSESPHNVVLSELEPILLRHSLLKPLLQLYKQHKETSKLLDLYSTATFLELEHSLRFETIDSSHTMSDPVPESTLSYPPVHKDKKFVILSDWDGTITTYDSNDYMTDHLGFGKEKRREGNLEILAGKVAFRDAFREMLQSVTKNGHTFEECKQVLHDNIKLDPGFKEFYAWCKTVDIPVILVSSGMAPLIRAVLSNLLGKEANEIEIIANDVTVEPNGQWEIKYRHPSSDFGHDKSQAILHYRNLPQPPTLFFFGDGVSDISAAKHADLLFVKSKPGGDNDLASYCKREGIKHVLFEDFKEALGVVKDVVDGKQTISDIVSAY